MEKAMIAMSGGIDSSVAALLTKEKGFECVGVTMKLFQNEDAGIPREKACCSVDDIEDARRICYRIGMPHYVFNFTEEFREEVMERFVDAYKNGITPNPCIDCNRYMKFRHLFRRMQETGGTYLITGHYARVRQDEQTGRFLLLKGADESKDQSYVLYNLTQEQLAHVQFPLGELRKDQVRSIAEDHGFINAGKHDSQDICFVPDGDYTAFIERYTGEMAKPGDFVDKEGKVLGRHEGITHYTIGQRRGLRFPAKTRIYVQKIDPVTNQVVLGKNEDLFTTELTANELNLITCDKLTEPLRVTAKVRYRHKEQPALAWQTEDGKLHVRFDQPQRAITRGQAVVLYQGDLVIGGGVIE